MQGTLKVTLYIRIVGDAAATQAVKIKVTTQPIKLTEFDANGDPVKWGFSTSTVKRFTRWRPGTRVQTATGELGPAVRSRHAAAAAQPPRLKFPDGDPFTAAQEGGGFIIGAWSNLDFFPSPTSVNFGGPADKRIWVIEEDGNPENPPNTGKRPPSVVSPENSIWFGNFQHEPGLTYLPINESGAIGDAIGYWNSSSTYSLTSSNNNYLFETDHSCDWICNWYYRDGHSAATYNSGGAASLPPSASPLGADLVRGAIQRFTIFSGSNRGQTTITKFNSIVTRALKGHTGEQIRTGNWPEDFEPAPPANP